MKAKDKQPGINFDSIILTNTNFSRTTELNPPLHIDLNFNVGKSLNDDKTKGQLELKADLTVLNEDDSSVMNLESTFIGFFSVQEGNENMNLSEFMKNNAPGLMFPYVREHISNITQKAGVPPLLLPPLNIYALLKKKKK